MKSDGFDDCRLWRSTEGERYFLSDPEAGLGHSQEGYTRLDTVCEMREMLEEISGKGVVLGSAIWFLMMDVNRQEGREWTEGEFQG